MNSTEFDPQTWKNMPRKHRTTWNYVAMTWLVRVAQFFALFIGAPFVISLLVRVVM